MGLLLYAWGPLEASTPATSTRASGSGSGSDSPSDPPPTTARRPLPSIDPACLAAITFLSLANANFHVIESNDPALSESGALPVVRDETAFFHGLDQVLARKSDRSLALDADLTPAQRADAVAIKALVVDKLGDILHYSWYIHPPNSTTTAQRFKSLLSLPSRWMHMRTMRKAAVSRINARSANDWASPLLLGPVHRPTVRLTPTAAVSASEVAARAAAEESAASAAARRRSSGMSTSAATFGTRARSSSRPTSDLGHVPVVGADGASDLSIRSTSSASPMAKPRISSEGAAAPLGTFHPPTISLDDEVCILSMEDTLHIARRVYTTLATLLGDRPYLLGDGPHSLDAVVFGYLALHYYPAMPNDTESSSSTYVGTEPPSLASLLLSDFPTLVAYLDRMYAAARIHTIQVERPLPTITRMLWTTAKDAALRVPRALSRGNKWKGVLHTVASVAAGAVILAGYVWLVKANEARQVAEAVQYAQAVARQRKLEARKAQAGRSLENEEEEQDVNGAFAESDEEVDADDEEFYDEDDD